MKMLDYEKIDREIENNEESVSALADKIFGTLEDITNNNDNALLKERAIFYQEGLKFMNELSLFLIKRRLKEDGVV